MLLFILITLCQVVWTQRHVPCDFDPPSENRCSATYQDKECEDELLHDTRFHTPTTFKVVPFDKTNPADNQRKPGGRISIQYLSDLSSRLFMISVKSVENVGCLVVNATLYNANVHKIVTVGLDVWPLERKRTYNFTGVWNSSTSSSSVFLMTTSNVPGSPQGWSMTLSYSLRGGTLPVHFTRPPPSIDLRTFKIYLCRESRNSKYRCIRDKVRRTAFVFPDVTEPGVYKLTVKPRWNECVVCYSVSTEAFLIDQGRIVNIFNFSGHFDRCPDGRGECGNDTNAEEGKHSGYDGTVLSTSDTYIDKPKSGPNREIRKIKRKLRRRFRNNSKRPNDAEKAATNNTSLDTETLLYSAIFVGIGFVFGAVIFFFCTYRCRNTSKNTKARATADGKSSQKDDQVPDVHSATADSIDAKPLIGCESLKKTPVYLLYATDVFQQSSVIHVFVQYLTNQWQCDVTHLATENKDVDEASIGKSMEEASYIIIVNSESAYNHFQLWGNPRYSGEDNVISTTNFVCGLNVIAKLSIGNKNFSEKLILVQFPFTRSEHVMTDFFTVENYQLPQDMHRLLCRIGEFNDDIIDSTNLLQTSEDGARLSNAIMNSMVPDSGDINNSLVCSKDKSVRLERGLQLGRFLIDPDDCSLFHNPSITPAVTLMEVDLDAPPYNNTQVDENRFDECLSGPRDDVHNPELSNMSDQNTEKSSSYIRDHTASEHPIMSDECPYSDDLPKFHPPSEDLSLTENQQCLLMQNINARYLESISEPHQISV